MDVTIVITPRERFSPFVATLKSLFATIPDSVPVIVVDVGASAAVLAEMRSHMQKRTFELIETGRFMLQNAARNIGLERVSTKWIVFADNDIDYTPGWLEALLENGEANDSAAVAPVTTIGPSEPPKIHHAGGALEFTRDDRDRLIVRDIHRYDGRRLPEAEAEDFVEAPLEHSNFEYHCVLVRTNAIRAIGGHDERLILHEYNESSLRIMQRGGRLTFEPRARVMYLAFEPYRREDFPYFLYRWSLDRAKTSDLIYMQNWGVYKDAGGTTGSNWGNISGKGWVTMHRARILETRIPRLPKALAKFTFIQRVYKATMRRLLRLDYLILDPRLSDDPNARILQHPGDRALERAGISVPPPKASDKFATGRPPSSS